MYLQIQRPEIQIDGTYGHYLWLPEAFQDGTYGHY